MTQTTPDTTGRDRDGLVGDDAVSVVRRRVAGVAGGVGTGRLTSS